MKTSQPNSWKTIKIADTRRVGGCIVRHWTPEEAQKYLGGSLIIVGRASKTSKTPSKVSQNAASKKSRPISPK